MTNATIGVLVRTTIRSPFRELFVAHYARFAPLCRAVTSPSVTLVAIDEERNRVDGVHTVAAQVAVAAVAVVGRHDRADLRLEGSPDLALRHLALLVAPVTTFAPGSNEVEYRLLDLRTGSGFSGEKGQPLVSVRCGGTAFFRCAGYTLLVLATGDPTDWPDDPGDAWEMIPERVYLDEGGPRPRRLASEPRDFDGHTTRVTTMGPVRLLAPVEHPVAALAIRGHRLGVSADALRDGVMLGRYDRCDVAQWTSDSSVSRAHLLIVEDGGRRWAVDLASTCGTTLGGAPFRVAPLGAEARLELACVAVQWAS